MELIRAINEAAKDYTPAQEPINETHPMTRMMLKAMDKDRMKRKEKESVKKSDKKGRKTLSDYMKDQSAGTHT